MVVDVPRLLEALGIAQGKARNAREVWCLCPAHVDRSPSWSIDLKDGKHFCFACSFGGGPLDLVMHARKLTRGEAAQWVRDSGLALDSATLPETRVVLRVGSLDRFVMPAEVQMAEPWPAEAQAYAERRGITREQIERWGIGYAATGRLAKRLVIPIVDWLGRLSGYTARTWSTSPVRYLTPSEAEHPRREVLFGERHWFAIGAEVVVVTEGAIDALAVERACEGRFAVAALSGASNSRSRLVQAKLARFGCVVLATDVDSAGDAAAAGLRVALARHTHVVRLRYPAGVDAAGMDRAGLAELIVDAVSR